MTVSVARKQCICFLLMPAKGASGLSNDWICQILTTNDSINFIIIYISFNVPNELYHPSVDVIRTAVILLAPDGSLLGSRFGDPHSLIRVL